MKTLVIAEKPSVGRDIARVLNCQKKNKDFIEGKDFVVTWGLGHLVTLADPEDYSDDYKEWNLETLPMMPEKMKLSVIPQTRKQYQTVKNLLHRNDISTIVIATDAGREGELVARLILDKAGNKKPIKRLWISSVTDKAIKDGFKNLKDGRAYNNLYYAAMSRAEADWLVGINGTRALTTKYNSSLSCGRVQTPTLSMIATREKEIKQFVPKTYYGLELITYHTTFKSSIQTFDEENLNASRKLVNKITTVKSIQKKVNTTPAPLLYDLTSLQQEANKRYQFSAKQTLNIMQRLYEHHKVLTYPRTDSRYLTKDIVETFNERLKAIAIGPYKMLAGPFTHKKFDTKAFYINDTKVSDHHAIIPTEQFVQLDHMTVDERKIYDLVVRRFLSVLFPPYKYEQTTITLDIDRELFTAKTKTVLDEGWKKAYTKDWEEIDSDEGKSLPDLTIGQSIEVSSLKITKGHTNPPSPFTEASLLAAMENPVKYLSTDNKELAKTLGETGGLGTVATRADIIEKLFSSFLLEKKGNFIYTTAKARQLLELVPNDLKQPELTANWELKLSKIANGQLKRADFMKEIRDYTIDLTNEIKSSTGTFRHENLTNKICPECGKKMLAVKGKNSELLVCQDRACGHRETISRTSNARCPKCHKKLKLIGKGETQTFVCSCGYKEKLEHFKERRKMKVLELVKKMYKNT
ncbi:DNA topoisomerase III [Lachnospiraceae bacterium TWA4]|nr:DNA topoisomerase III [Lachnospiraceae bacterium TWA4]